MRFLIGNHHRYAFLTLPNLLSPEPSAAEIQLALTQKEADQGTGTGTVAWIANGINLRAAQYVGDHISVISF